MPNSISSTATAPNPTIKAYQTIKADVTYMLEIAACMGPSPETDGYAAALRQVLLVIDVEIDNTHKTLTQTQTRG